MNAAPTPGQVFASKAPQGPTYRIFTVDFDRVSEGVKVERVPITGVSQTIDAVIVGQEGRGRRRAVLPCPQAPMLPCPDQGQEVFASGKICPKCQTGLPEKAEGSWQVLHPVVGQVQGCLMVASVGTTKSGKPRLNRAGLAVSDDAVILVLRTPMGFRGGNAHTGVATGWSCGGFSCKAAGEGEMPSTCPSCGAQPGGWSGLRRQFASFPGEFLAEGQIAEGAAGRMGSGQQIVAVVKRDAVIRVNVFTDGRRPASVKYGWWDGTKFVLLTAEQYQLYRDAE